MTTSGPTVVDAPAAHRFEVWVDGAPAGFAEYRRRGGAVAFTHTVVEDGYAGGGVGSALVRGALDAVRAEGSSVLPFCPFVRGYIQRHPGYVDLVPAERRAQFGLARDPEQRPVPDGTG